MMQKKLIAIDLDGTTLRNDATISNETKRVLAEVRAQGHAVMIATGRPYRMSQQFYKELRLDTPIVNFNGAYLHHPTNTRYEGFRQNIALKTAHDVFDFAKTLDLNNIIAEVDESVYIWKNDQSVPQNMREADPRLIHYGAPSQLIQSDPTALMFSANNQQLATIKAQLDSAFAGVIEHRSWGKPYEYLELTKSGLNKAVALRQAASDLGFSMADVIAFGDADNDWEMLAEAGIGVAMGNADAETKRIANEITLSNEEDGIAAFLTANVLNK
ncbi:Cof-type HAD-IIB family hydrolase [Brochothrix campestris]